MSFQIDKYLRFSVEPQIQEDPQIKKHMTLHFILMSDKCH